MSLNRPSDGTILLFYRGIAPDTQGRMIEDIWNWDNEDLECVHDYIQWLFPLPEPSAFHPDAPLLSPELVQIFRQDKQLRQHLRQSLTVMLPFYGLQWQVETPIRITCAETFPQRHREWIEPLNHNYLRITRILKSLVYCGLEESALALFACLTEIYRDFPDAIGWTTFQYWSSAVGR